MDINYHNHIKVIHTDSITNVQRIATVHDTNPGRHGYTGIIYSDTGEFEFVDEHELLTDNGTWNTPNN